MASWNDLCRSCLSPDSKVSLLDDKSEVKERFREITTIEVKPDDGLPQKLCSDCLKLTNRAYQFRQQCIKMNQELKSQLEALLAQQEHEFEDLEDDEDFASNPMKQLAQIVKKEPSDDISDDDCYYVLVIDDPKDKEKKEFIQREIKTETVHDVDESTNEESELGMVQHEDSTSDAFEKSSFLNTKVPVNVPATILENEEESPEGVENMCVTTMDADDSQDSTENIFPDFQVKQEQLHGSTDNLHIETIEVEEGKELDNNNVIKILATTDADGTIILKGTDGVQYFTDTQFVTGEDGEIHEEEVIYCEDENSQFQIMSCDNSELIIEYAGDEDEDQITTVYQQEDGTFLCDCGEQFEDLTDYEQHQFVHNPAGDHLCNLCGKGFESAEILNGHLVLHRVTGEMVPCPYCQHLFKRNTLTQHIKYAHNKIKPQCHLCAKTFANANNLKRHLMIHSGVREFECDICFKRFHQKITMQTHRLTHISPFSCHECDELFDTKALLQAHKESNACTKSKVKQVKMDLIKTVKQEVKTNMGKLLGYACSLCKKMFSLEMALEQHVENIHMIEQTEMECTDCNETFATKKELHSHMVVHRVYMNRNKKRFPCSLCGKACASQAMLVMHERVHTNERPFPCELCPLQFKTKTHLRTHQLTHTREKKFGCSVCMKFFALKGNLVVHLRTHTGERPYTCSLCGESFIDSKYLKKHKLKKHNIANVHWNEYNVAPIQNTNSHGVIQVD